MEERERVGVVIFDSETVYGSDHDNPGYSCLPGEEPVRIYGVGDLPTNIRWLTNINLDVAYANRLQNSPKLLNTNFLRTSVKSILVELGLRDRPSSEQAYIVAQIFDNVMLLASKVFGVNETPTYSLNQAFPGQIGHYQLPIEEDVRKASILSAQSYGQCETSHSKDAVYTSVVFPRFQYSNRMLKAGLPWGEWIKISAHGTQAERLDYVLNSDLPLLCKMCINKISKKFHPLINYGAGAGQFSRKGRAGGEFSVQNDRHYATSNEIKFLSQFSDIVIEEIYECDERLEMRYQLPSTDRISMLSYSYGLLCENLWTCLDRDKDGRRHQTPASAWLHAEDRIACLKVAAEFHKKGYKVLSYGYGRITIALEPEMAHKFVSDSLSLKVVPALGAGTKEVVSLPDEPAPEDFMIGLFGQGNIQMLLDVDKQFVSMIKNS